MNNDTKNKPTILCKMYMKNVQSKTVKVKQIHVHISVGLEAALSIQIGV